MENTHQAIKEGMDEQQKIDAIYSLRNEVIKQERIILEKDAEIRTLKYAFEKLIPESSRY